MNVLYLIGCWTSLQFDFLSVLVVFCFQIIVVLLLVAQGSTVCLPTPPPWPEVSLYDLFNIVLDGVCQYFVEDFSIYVHQPYWPVVFFLCYVFIWFWD